MHVRQDAGNAAMRIQSQCPNALPAMIHFTFISPIAMRQSTLHDQIVHGIL